jgi:hypothetical protein
MSSLLMHRELNLKQSIKFGEIWTRFRPTAVRIDFLFIGCVFSSDAFVSANE